MQYSLNDTSKISIEPDRSKLRILIHRNAEEWVCRKETVARIKQFLTCTEARLFKGRLQLCKVNQEIYVEVKGEVVGIIKRDDFVRMIDQHS
jgi:hypothetical protein